MMGTMTKRRDDKRVQNELLTILIIDDSPTELHVLKSYLHKQGWQVITASSGEMGIKLARQMRPDLILMDVVMPGLNGFQATRELKRNAATKAIPVVIISTKGQETDLLWGKRQGATDYLVKPVAEDDLLACVRRILDVG